MVQGVYQRSMSVKEGEEAGQAEGGELEPQTAQRGVGSSAVNTTRPAGVSHIRPKWPGLCGPLVQSLMQAAPRRV